MKKDSPCQLPIYILIKHFIIKFVIGMNDSVIAIHCIVCMANTRKEGPNATYIPLTCVGVLRWG